MRDEITSQGSYSTLIHSDWSKDPRKRWAVKATRRDGVWVVSEPYCVGDSTQFLEDLFIHGKAGRVLAGFDFPIGVPEYFGRKTELGNFREALIQFGSGRWANFYDVTDQPKDIGLGRPFYPRRARRGVRREHLIQGHALHEFDQLMRACELGTSSRKPACPLFWTLGAQQVGKAAIAGWQEILVPAIHRGAKLWPFDGTLSQCASASVVIAETYPAEAYGHLKATFASGESKRRQLDRARRAVQILSWVDECGIELADKMKAAIRDGFGSRETGEDEFDASLGLFGMIEVVEGHQPEGVTKASGVRLWEGWILGMAGQYPQDDSLNN
jgi:hypothetical protein